MKGILIATLLANIASAHEITSHHLKEVTIDNYNEIVMSNVTKSMEGPWFIMFYAPWCGHCKKLIPIWNEFADMNGGDPYKLNIGIVNCDEHQELCTAFDITSYPRLLFLFGN